MHQNRPTLRDRLHPDPLGELMRSPDLVAAMGATSKGRGKERRGGLLIRGGRKEGATS